MGVLRFETNIPQTVALKFADGKEVEGRFGNQILYTLTSGDTMYLHPSVAAKINMLEPNPGEPITLCKREVKDGRRKGVEWEVSRAQESGAVGPASSPAMTTANRPSATSSNRPIQPVQPQHSDSAAPAQPEIVHTQLSQAMTGCLIAAIDSLATAARYAEHKGLDLDGFNGEDVRAIASTLYIQHCRIIEQRLRGSSWQQ